MMMMIEFLRKKRFRFIFCQFYSDAPVIFRLDLLYTDASAIHIAKHLFSSSSRKSRAIEHIIWLKNKLRYLFSFTQTAAVHLGQA